MTPGIVLDTNVFVSGIFWKGPPSNILSAWRGARLNLIVSPEILDEYARVAVELNREFPGVDIAPFVGLLATHALIVRGVPMPNPICADPSDDKFFACALAARAECIVSGDKHLLNVSGFRGVQVFRPRQFVDMYLSH